MAQLPNLVSSSTFSSGQTTMASMILIHNFQVQVHSVDRLRLKHKRLGYLVDVDYNQFFLFVMKSYTEYSSQVNQFNIKDNYCLYKDNLYA